MPNSYYDTESTDGHIQLVADSNWGTATAICGHLSVKTTEKGLHPQLVFKYIKSKFGLLEKASLDRRLKKLETAFLQAVENGQEALGNKILRELTRETRESVLYVKGYKYFVEREDVWKHKRNIKGGHISDTKFEDFTKVIPKDVLKKKKEAEPYFDGFVIYHYYNNEMEEKIAKKQKMSEEEKSKMKDPILFGWIKECDRLYFIADWEDEYCDLTFDEIVDVVGENKLTKYPQLND